MPFSFFGTGDVERDVADRIAAMTSTIKPWFSLTRPENWPFGKFSQTSESARNETEGGPDATTLDRLIHAGIGQMTGGISPASLGLAFTDWAIHFAISPGHQSHLAKKTLRNAVRLSLHAFHAGLDPAARPCFEPRPGDRRFADPKWCNWPYNIFYQSFLLAEETMELATGNIRGVTAHHQRIVSFVGRQWLDMISPSNFPLTNPEVVDRTVKEGGTNLVRGAANLVEDSLRRIVGEEVPGMENFRPGHEVATTPGKVIYRNRLIELIQYSPQTEQTISQPLLIVPAWIMKYYILDLSPHNSLIGYLVKQGFTVFCISWRNPGADDRNLGMEDYRLSGVVSALRIIAEIIPGQKINLLGYCLGGTLTAITAAHMAREGVNDLASVTLLAAETDFREAGELRLFIDESQIAFLEDLMWDKGYLKTEQMSGAFQLLRSADLVWSRNLKSYLLGERETLNDLMSWNADGTRLPYRMHSEYLHHLFLNNELAEGRYQIDGAPVALSDIRAPIFMVGTETDHVAPWKSVYRLKLYADTDVTFLLTSGGHNTGVVSEPGHPHRHFRVTTKTHLDPYHDPDSWAAETPVQDGSWWPAFVAWLKGHGDAQGAPPPMGAPGHPPMMDAPGTYVLQR